MDVCLHDSIVVSIPACHAGDRGSIPRRGAFFILEFYALVSHKQRSCFRSWQISKISSSVKEAQTLVVYDNGWRAARDLLMVTNRWSLNLDFQCYGISSHALRGPAGDFMIPPPIHGPSISVD